MHTARTLLVLVSFVGGLMEVASAQHKYIFPQFAFGGGWESTLMVQALDGNTTCTFSAQGRFFTMRDSSGNSLSGTQLPVVLGMNEGTILKTATPQGMAASSGMAVLDCDEEVSANTLFSLEVGGSLVAEALVESSEEIVSGEPVRTRQSRRGSPSARETRTTQKKPDHRGEGELAAGAKVPFRPTALRPFARRRLRGSLHLPCPLHLHGLLLAGLLHCPPHLLATGDELADFIIHCRARHRNVELPAGLHQAWCSL